MPEFIRVKCPGCKKVVRVPGASGGFTAVCPFCEKKFLIPRKDAAKAEPGKAQPGKDQAKSPPAGQAKGPDYKLAGEGAPAGTTAAGGAASPPPAANVNQLVNCGQCGMEMIIDSGLYGRLLTCPTCGWRFTLGGGPAPQADPFSALAQAPGYSPHPGTPPGYRPGMSPGYRPGMPGHGPGQYGPDHPQKKSRTSLIVGVVATAVLLAAATAVIVAVNYSKRFGDERAGGSRQTGQGGSAGMTMAALQKQIRDLPMRTDAAGHRGYDPNVWRHRLGPYDRKESRGSVECWYYTCADGAVRVDVDTNALREYELIIASVQPVPK